MCIYIIIVYTQPRLSVTRTSGFFDHNNVNGLSMAFGGYPNG